MNSTWPDGSLAAVQSAWAVGVVEVVPVDEACGERAELLGHRELVAAVAVSRDGDLLLSGGRGGEIILWDARTLLAIARLVGAQAPVADLAFGAGDAVAAGLTDGTVLEWQLGVEALTELTCDKLAGTDLPEAEWERYGGQPRRCP